MANKIISLDTETSRARLHACCLQESDTCLLHAVVGSQLTIFFTISLRVSCSYFNYCFYRDNKYDGLLLPLQLLLDISLGRR